MKKLFTVLAIAAVFMITTGNAQAEDKYVVGGFEMSGSVLAGAGYQHHNNKAPTYLVTDNDGVTYDAGVMGKYLGMAPLNRSDHFAFFLDGVELNLMKSFGENIRTRVDMSFGRIASSGRNTAAFILEQGYATANIPIGNGLEVLLGRFNAPLGFESVSTIENYLISKSALAEGLRPGNLTGAKLYYSFSDLIDLHLYVVNNLYNDTTVKISDIPSAGLRLGFNWGEEGTESTIGVSGLFGPETRASNKHYLFGGDLDANWWVTESFAVGAEGLFLQVSDSTTIARAAVTAGEKNYYMAGLLNLHYLFSEVWDGTFQYLFAKQFHPNSGTYAANSTFNATAAATGVLNLMGTGAGVRQAVHQVALGGGYAIADGAKLKIEGRVDMVKPSAGGATQYVYGGALAFAYNF